MPRNPLISLRIFRRAVYPLAVVLLLTTCASQPKSGNDLMFAEFTLLVEKKETLLQVAHDALLELYPYSLITPLSKPRIGYSVNINYQFDYPFMGIYDPFNSFVQRYLEIDFTQSLGRTLDGSIVTGYRYSILSYPFSTSYFPNHYYDIEMGGYILDYTHFHDLDLVFRSELFKHRIEPVVVTRVM